MELSWLLAQQTMSFAIMIMMGFAVVRAGLIKSEDSQALSTLTIYVISPCMVVYAFQLEYSGDRLYGLLLALGAALLYHVIFIPVSALAARKLHLSAAEQGSIVYTNAGNFIVPLVYAILGREHVFYASAFVAVMNIFFFSHGVIMLGTDKKIQWKKIFLNPNMLAIFVGIFMFLTQIRFPSLIDTTISNVGGIIGPVSMLLIGMLMAGEKISSILRSPRVWGIVVTRLIVIPILFMALLRVTGMTRLFPHAGDVLLVTMLAVAAPVAVMVTQVRNMYGAMEDAKHASAVNVLSVFVCIVTLPLMIMLYQAIR